MTDRETEFQKLFEIFQPKVLHYLSRLVGECEAEDLTQEVFVKVGKGLKSFRGESQLSTWIYRIATNTAVDFMRGPCRQAASRGLPINSEEEENHGDMSLEETTSPVDREIIRKEMNECIRSFIDKLPVDYRTVIILGEIEELKNQEIASILQISLDAVKIRLHRARARLKKELEAHCSFYRDERNELACDRKIILKNPKLIS